MAGVLDRVGRRADRPRVLGDPTPRRCWPATAGAAGRRHRSDDCPASGIRVRGSRFTVHGSRFTVRGSRFGVHGFTVRASHLPPSPRLRRASAPHGSWFREYRSHEKKRQNTALAEWLLTRFGAIRTRWPGTCTNRSDGRGCIGASRPLSRCTRWCAEPHRATNPAIQETFMRIFLKDVMYCGARSSRPRLTATVGTPR
jgi:hypothetical protein